MQDWTPEDLKRHLEAGDRVFLKLWKKGCGVCKLSTPATDRIEAANKHGLIYGRINAEDHPELLELSGSEVLPTFIVFGAKKRLGQFVGFKGLKALEEFLDGAMSQA